jgi:enamine deaminase RidA (YjgF/YER057c/UK114 family)
VPAAKELIIMSGHTPPIIDPAAAADSLQAFGDTYTQTVGAFQELAASLARLGLGFGDLVQSRALLVGDPAFGGRMDSAGFSRAYAAFFLGHPKIRIWWRRPGYRWWVWSIPAGWSSWRRLPRVSETVGDSTAAGH